MYARLPKSTKFGRIATSKYFRSRKCYKVAPLFAVATKSSDFWGVVGRSETYLAEDLDIPTSPKPKCVVKHLRPQSNNPAIIQIAQNLFNREAEVLYRLSNLHSEIPKLHAHFEEKQEFYLVQEFVDGEDLSKEFSPGKRLDENAVKQLVEDILTVLAVVHERKIIHRDIKPANLMRRHSNGKIVLIDFGAVKEIMTVNATGQTSTVAIGTPGYMQARTSDRTTEAMQRCICSRDGWNICFNWDTTT